MANLIRAFNVSREFRLKGKTISALQDIDLKVDKGEPAALIGPNAAGKTTFVRILSTILPPTSGEAFVNGYSVTEDAANARKSLGVLVGTERGFNNRLSGFDNLVYWLSLYNFSLREAKSKAYGLLSLVGLHEYRNLAFMKYSLGMKKRLALARALVSDPAVLVLDEPTAGIDVVSAMNLRLLMKNLAKDRTLLLTTHVMRDAEVIADRVLFIKEGKLIADERVEDITRSESLEEAYVKYVGHSSSDLKPSSPFPASF